MVLARADRRDKGAPPFGLTRLKAGARTSLSTAALADLTRPASGPAPRSADTAAALRVGVEEQRLQVLAGKVELDSEGVVVDRLELAGLGGGSSTQSGPQRLEQFRVPALDITITPSYSGCMLANGRHDPSDTAICWDQLEGLRGACPDALESTDRLTPPPLAAGDQTAAEVVTTRLLAPPVTSTS